jgi:hypothetical protein
MKYMNETFVTNQGQNLHEKKRLLEVSQRARGREVLTPQGIAEN